jgi:uncharacterized protein YdhG (YjbR/CyaY superfamily)
MFIIDWVMDKFGFVHKASIEFPIAKPVAKKPVKKTVRKNVRKTVQKKG